jgi:tripartite-type tricarboxylate transporter receptor subunit TctC
VKAANLILGALLVLSFASATAARADEYPSRTIRILVLVAPGGPLDFTARVMAERLSRKLGQSAIVENRPGGSTLLATQVVADAKPDGYTILLGSASMASYATFIKDLRVDVLKDLAFISTVATFPYIVASSNKKGISSLKQLIGYAHEHPGQANYGTYGNHSRIETVLFNQAAGIDAVRIPYFGSAPAHTALIAGDIDYILTDIGTLQPLLDAKQANLIAAGSDARLKTFPDVKTLKEQGLNLPVLAVWYGLVAPGATPTAIIDRLNRAVTEIGDDPTFQQNLLKVGIQPLTTSSAGFKTLATNEKQLFEQTAKAVGISPE